MVLTSSDPWEQFRERMRNDPFIGPFFTEIDREFDRMQDTFQRMLEQAQESAGTGEGTEPFVYGFSFKMGPDGRPVFNDFGNARPRIEAGGEGAREPLVDVITGEDTVSVTAELPGVDKKDVKLRASEDGLTIQVDSEGRRYYKRVALPVKVRPDTTKATYKNGVLDVEVERAEPGSEEGTEVPVE